MVALTSPARPSDDERRKVLHEWNATATEFPDACVHELFERQVERSPDAVAVVSGGARVTYRELDQRANQVANFLRGRGVGPEVLVGVCLERSVELVIALLGVWKAGGAYVPLDPVYPAERLEFMVRDASIGILLTEHGCKHLFSAGIETVCLDADWSRVAREPGTRPGASAAPSNLAYVMYTSGSTGQPKGAEILHSGLVNYLWWAIRAYGLEAGGSVPVHTSVSFDLTVTSLYPALLAGGQVELLGDAAAAQSLLAALRRGPARNIVKITPAHLDVLSQQLSPDEVAGMTKMFVIGGENLAAEGLRLWREHAPDTRLVNEYGPTETVVGCCVHEVRSEDPRSGSVPIGRPIANTQLYVLDAELQPVAPGVTGELYIGGAGVARGYLRRPELTRERFLPDPFSGRDGARIYKTGDLARHREDGTLEYLGRVDTQIKLRGYRIELGEIEAALTAHPTVQSCAVIVREDPETGKQLAGYVVARPGEAPAAAALQAFLKERLPEYMVPSRIALLPSLPLTQNGKVDRKALAAQPVLEAAPTSGAVAPRNETETALVAIWRELLRVAEVGIHDDFFDLGGHSLLALKVLARIREVLDVELPPGSLFENPTVAGLAPLVSARQRKDDHVHHIAPRDRRVPCPLSYGQAQLWFLHQLAPESPAYNIVDVATIHGAFSAPSLRLALGELVRRHEVLRTSFVSADTEVDQVVHDALELAVPETDLTGLPDAEGEREWSRIVHGEGSKPFDLAAAPLLRTVMVHVSPDEHRLLIVIHHIISDEWSLEVLQTELRDLYAAFKAGRPSPLAPAKVQYADFASWQRARLQGDALATQQDYWRKKLSGATTVLALPTDGRRPPHVSFRGATELFSLSRRTADRLHALGRQSHATLFMVLEAAFAALLHRWTGQDDVLVGTPISGRTRADTEGMVGYFLNTIVLRSRFADGASFRALLDQTRALALEAYANADVPFEHVVRVVAPERDPSRSPLFQAMFILHDRDTLSWLSKLSEHQALHNGTAKFDLTLYMSETEAGIEGLLEYGADLFEPETARALCRSMTTLLEAIAEDAERPLSQLPLLAQADRQRQLEDWNDTTRTFAGGDVYLHELFEQQARRTPDRTAVVCGGQSLAYADLDRRANAIARRLAALGVGADAPVGLFVQRSLDMMVGLLGILKAGGAYVPLDPAFPPGRLANMIEDSGMRVLVTHGDMDRSLPARPEAVLHLDRDDGERASPSPPPDAAARDTARLAYVLYTSGSTGRPKGVAVPHAAIVNFLRSMQIEPGLSESDVMVAVTTLSFDIAGLELFLPLITGARVVVASREDAMDPQRLMDLLRESRCTLLQATPATWRALIAAGWAGGPELRALCGGEAMPLDLVGGLLQRCGELWNMYGPTETTVWSTLDRLMTPDAAPLIGRPIANTQTYVLDAHRQLLPAGAVGELYIGGTGVARGYLNRPELTRERFVDNPFVPGERLYRTGDLARWRRSGRLECLGRTDHQVKVRGYRIELGEIEAVLTSHPAVRQAVVVAREDTPGDRRLVAYVVADGREGIQEELRAHARASLPEYMVPTYVLALGALPLTPNGKVDRNALPAPDASSEPRVEDIPARDPIEILVARIWEDVLGTKVTSVRQSFFDLGGHSLLAVRVFARIRDATGIALPIATLLATPTVEHLAESVRERLAAERGGRPSHPPDTSLVCFRHSGARPPLFCIHGAGGNVLNLHDLARHLPPDRPFYAFQARGVDGHLRPHDSIEEMADAYLTELRAVQARGPYYLAGYCGGTLVAFELAARLLSEGERVAFLGVIDLYRPGLPLASSRLGNLVSAMRRQNPATLAKQVPLKLKAAARESFSELRVRFHEARHDVMPYELRERWLMAAFMRAAQRYELRPYRGKLTVFRARDGNRGENGAPILRDPGPELGWGPLATLGIEAHEAPGDHQSLVVPPNVGVLASQLEDCLREAETPHRSS